MYDWLLWSSAAQALGHMHGVRHCPTRLHFLTSNFADGKNMQFMIPILLRPTCQWQWHKPY